MNMTAVPENPYRGELLSYPGPWSFLLGKETLILVSDQDLLDLSDPDKVVDLSLTYEPRRESLRQIRERAQAQGQRTLILAYNHFFGQYRPGQHEPRRLMPDMPEYVERVAVIARFAAGYGLGLELSLLSPLEIGPAYRAATGESGLWLHARKGLRDPATGAFDVHLWQHRRWVNNKGVVELEDAGARVFAFSEAPVPGTPYRVVDPDTIREITDVAAGLRVLFEGTLAGVAPQTILTGFLVDRIYPVTPIEGTDVVARVKSDVVGTVRTHAGGGVAAFLGFRPRDDQSRSLGYEARTLFEILHALGAYPPSGLFAGENDNTEYLSRTTAHLFCRFPNGAVAVAPHYHQIEEDWPGDFARDEAADRAILDKMDLPSRAVTLRDTKIHGHVVAYDGVGAMAFRVDEGGNMIAFAGEGAATITVDGRRVDFADAAEPGAVVAWAPVSPTRRVAGGAVVQALATRPGHYRIPAGHLPAHLRLVAEGATPGSRGLAISSRRDGDIVDFTVTPETAGRWIYGVPEARIEDAP